MLFRNPTKQELIVYVPEDRTPPKAVVVLFGWFGCRLRHVQKYSKLYEDRGCATITCYLDERTVMTADYFKANELAEDVVRETAKLLRLGGDGETAQRPVILHAFSNGGGLALQTIELKLAKLEKDATVFGPDWQVFRQGLRRGAEVFDSAPAFLTWGTMQGAVTSGISNPILQTIFLAVVASIVVWTEFCSLLAGKRSFIKEYWVHWLTAPPVVSVQAYLYSSADPITISSKIDELIEVLRKNKKGLRVLSKRFNDTHHVQHMIKHKKEYCELLDQVLSVTTT